MSLAASALICLVSVANFGCAKEDDPVAATPAPSVGTTPCSGKIIFTTAVSNGNFGGAAGADVICNANKPTGYSSSTFKALLTDNTRRACYSAGNDNCGITGVTGRVDWVLPASSNLCTSDLRLVGTTDSNKFIDYIYPAVLSSTATVTFTGFNVSWGQSATNCSNFASTAGTGIAGSAHVGMAGLISYTIPNCNVAGTIYCVQQ
jgi:hypothetical protein